MRCLNPYLYVIEGLAILTGFALSVLSYLNFCSSACSQTHGYLVFGIPFGVIGLCFFGILTITYFFSYWNPNLFYVIGLLLAVGLGAEIMMIYLQKYIIGAWCPVCLGIAASVSIAAMAQLGSYLSKNKEDIMKKNWKMTPALSAMVFGFLVVFLGVAKADPLQAAEEKLQESIAFGNQSSNIEMYVFSDWFCYGCRIVEPELEKITHAIEGQTKVIFIDFPIHPETMNFTPYNLSFMINNKPNYFKLRNVLLELSKTTKEPTEEEVEKATESVGSRYEQLNYSDIALGTKYFKKMAKELDIAATPSLVIVNRDTKKGKKLQGAGNITKENVLKAIEQLKEG